MANNNACVPPPPELRDLSLGEQIFVARGFAVRRLRTLTTSGDPAARQRGLRGTASAIAFPQNAATVFSTLPLSAARLSDYLSVFFTDETRSNLRFCPEFVVRRSAVQSALQWLKQHNPYYADVVVGQSAVQALPHNEVPAAWLASAHRTTVELTRGFGPSDSSSAPADHAPSSAVHAAVLDPGTDHTDPVQLWNTALLACERFERHASHQPETAIADVQLAHHALQRLAAASNHSSFERDSVHQQATTAGSTKIYVAVPHADTPLDSYDPSFWAMCFPCLFPFGDGIDGQPRPRYLSDHAWGSLLLRRRDRSFPTHWRKDLDFISILFSVLHRRRLLRAVRVRIQAPTFRDQVPSLNLLRSADWSEVATTIGEQLFFLSVFLSLPFTSSSDLVLLKSVSLDSFLYFPSFRKRSASQGVVPSLKRYDRNIFHMICEISFDACNQCKDRCHAQMLPDG